MEKIDIIDIIDFEKFCKKNDVKPTKMKADYYLAGHYKGQQRMREKACEAYCNVVCQSEQTSGKRCYWRVQNERCQELESFIKAMEE